MSRPPAGLAVAPTKPLLDGGGLGRVFPAQPFDAEADLADGEHAQEEFCGADGRVPGKDVGIRLALAEFGHHIDVKQKGH